MAHYRFRIPNLLEILLAVALIFVIVFGFWLILRALGTIPEGVSITMDVVRTVFSYLSLIFLGIICLILEAIREELRR